MKNFDEARDARRDADRTFQLGGETFTRVAGVRPEQLFAYDGLAPGSPSDEIVRVMDETLLEFVVDEDGAHDRYRKLREKGDSRFEDHPMTLDDVVEVVRWLIEEATGHPTSAPVPSTRGRVSTIPSSAAPESSQEQVRTA